MLVGIAELNARNIYYINEEQNTVMVYSFLSCIFIHVAFMLLDLLAFTFKKLRKSDEDIEEEQK